MSEVRTFIRQGDILLVPVDEDMIPKDAQEGNVGNVIVGLGERSGHQHLLETAQWVVTDRVAGFIDEFIRGEIDPDSSLAEQFFVWVPEATELRQVNTLDPSDQKVHDPHTVAAGAYQVYRQREFSPSRSRAVWD